MDLDGFRRYLLELAGEKNGEAGFFDPRGVMWRVSREPVLLVAGMRALLMQVAHPKVAQGVADHSAYRTDPLGRGVRTFTAVYAIVFGTREEAVAAAMRVRGIHARVRGRVRAAALPDGVDSHYTAEDPQLLFWVAATLLDSAVIAYERFVARLSPDDKERLYSESKRFGQMFGVPLAMYPPTWPDFREWMNETLTGSALTVTPAARDICRSLLNGTWLTRLAAPVNYVTAAMLLPPSLASDYGLRRGAAVRVAYGLLAMIVTALVHAVPRRWRGVPAARRAERRVESTRRP